MNKDIKNKIYTSKYNNFLFVSKESYVVFILKFFLWWLIKCMLTLKLLFTTLCFVGLHSVPNLIVILFNLLYPVFIVGFHCKGCVLERECVKTQAIED